MMAITEKKAAEIRERTSMPDRSDELADAFSKRDGFDELRSELGELDPPTELRIVGARQSPRRSGGIEVWISEAGGERTLWVSTTESCQEHEVLFEGARALARLQGFPNDRNGDLEAEALIEASAWEMVSGAFGDQPALAEAVRVRERIHKRLGGGALSAESQRSAALKLWATLCPLRLSEREELVAQIKRMDPVIVAEIEELQRRWGSLAPVTPVAAWRMIEGEFEREQE